MKRIVGIVLIIIWSLPGNSQILLEDKTGDKIVTNFFNLPDNNFGLVKLTTGDQSLGFNFFTSTKLHDPAKYRVSSYGLKGKPTEGYAAVITNGQFSPGINMSYSLTQVSIFADGFTGKLKPIDWGGIDLSYDVNKYSLYKRDTSFGNQMYSKTFKGLNIGVNYNLILKQSLILSFKLGYSRRNNYDELTSVEIKDTKTILDTASSTQRLSSVAKTVKSGEYIEFDAYPIVFSITKATASDAKNSADTAKLKIGYTFYVKTLASQKLPKTDAGIIIFLTRQGKSGVRTPIFGVNIQAKDFFDVQKSNNGLLNRIQVGFTTNFTL